MRIQDIIRRPLITEKSTQLKEEKNIVAFEVDRRANKIDVRRAVEHQFKVKVAEVRYGTRARKDAAPGHVTSAVSRTGRRPTFDSPTARRASSSSRVCR